MPASPRVRRCRTLAGDIMSIIDRDINGDPIMWESIPAWALHDPIVPEQSAVWAQGVPILDLSGLRARLAAWWADAAAFIVGLP